MTGTDNQAAVMPPVQSQTGPPAPAVTAAERPFFNPRRLMQLAAVALAWVAIAFCLFGVTGQEVTTDTTGLTTTKQMTLLEMEGFGLLVPLAIPLILALLPLAWRGSAWHNASLVCGLLLVLYCVLSGLSIGVFFLPTTALMLISLALPADTPKQPTENRRRPKRARWR